MYELFFCYPFQLVYSFCRFFSIRTLFTLLCLGAVTTSKKHIYLAGCIDTYWYMFKYILYNIYNRAVMTDVFTVSFGKIY